MSELSVQCQRKARAPGILELRVYSTAVLSVYCGQVSALVEFGEIKTLRRRHGTCFPPPPHLFVYATCRRYLRL